MKTDVHSSESKSEEFTLNHKEEIDSLSVPFFPTPPYENADDWIVPMDLKESAVLSSSAEQRSETEDFDISSELETNDLFESFDFSKFGVDSAIDQFVSELDINIEQLNASNMESNNLSPKDKIDSSNTINDYADSESDSNVSGDESIKSDNMLVTDEPCSKYIPKSCKNIKRHSNSSVESNESNFEPAIKMLKVSYPDQFHHDVEDVPLRKRYPKQREPVNKGKTLPKTSKRYAKDKEEHDILANVHPSRRAAVQAKLNREKKKAYISHLEMETNTLKSENIALTECKLKLEKNCEKLQNEVAYLRNVLANQSALSGLLKNIGNTEGVILKSSFNSNKNNSSVGHRNDHDYVTPSPKVHCSKSDAPTQSRMNSGGICLHVDKDNVSLEFCSKCAKKAKLVTF